MAFNIQDYVEPVAFGNAVYNVTGQLVDSAIAAGYAQWIKGITGTLPVIQSIDAKRVKIVFTPDQIPVMRKWLDSQVSGAFRRDVSQNVSTVEYDLGSVLNMWAAKYAVPTVMGVLIAGFIAGYMVHKMRIF